MGTWEVCSCFVGLCVNQDDIQERSDQVKGMRGIYSSAQTTRIWFGNELVSAASQMIQSTRLDRLFQRTRLAQYGEMPVVLSFVAQAMKHVTTNIGTDFPIGFPESSEPEWEILIKFFQQPWFSRVWTMQESVMVKKGAVCVGDWELDWDCLCKATIFFYETSLGISLKSESSGLLGALPYGLSPHRPKSGIPIYQAEYMSRIRCLAGSRPPLYELLGRARDRAATCLEDYVFAILALASEFSGLLDGSSAIQLSEQADLNTSQRIFQEYSLLQPDYSKSAAEGFRNTAVFMLRYHSSLEFLKEVDFTDTKALGCPS